LLERKRERARDCRNKGDTCWDLKRAHRSVPSQWYHSGDATSNRERVREREKIRDREKRERKREGARRLQKEGRHT